MLIAYRLGNTEPYEIIISEWTVDSSLPTINTMLITNQAVLWDTLDTPNAKVTIPTTVVDEGARIDAELDTVYLHKKWWYTGRGGVHGSGEGTSYFTEPIEGGTFSDYVYKSDIGRATEIRYYTEAVDRAFNRSWDVDHPEDPLFWHLCYVSRRGDIDVDGFISDHDAELVCLHLIHRRLFDPDLWEIVFANADGIDGITWDDYDWIIDHRDTPYPYRIAQRPLDIGDQIEVGVGSGAKGSQGNIVPLLVKNDSTLIKEVVYNLAYDESVLSLTEKTTTGRTQGFSVNDGCAQHPQSYVELYGEASSMISQGSGSVANLSFSVDPDAVEGSYHITLTSGDLSDTSEVAVPHLKMRGKFFIGEPPPVSIVCTPECDTTLERGDTLNTTLERGDTLTIYTTLTNHHWQGVTASVFMYGTVTPDSMNPFLVIDTTYVYLPPNARVSSFAEIEVPGYAPLKHYLFTGYSGESQAIYDTDSFGFDIVDTTGIMEGGGPEMASSDTPWKLLTGWFGAAGQPQDDKEESFSSPAIPKSLSLSQNYPNPFNPHTTIRYGIPEGISAAVKLTIYSLRGKRIKTADLDSTMPGIREYTWDGRDDSGLEVPSGVYIYRLAVGNKVITKKMSLVR